MKKAVKEKENPLTQAIETVNEQVTSIARMQPRQGPVEGFENMDAADVTQPRLMLAQSMTPQRQKDDEKCIKGLEEGQFFNSVTGEVYGAKVMITPVMFFKQNLLLGDIDEGGGLLCRAVDGKHGVGDPGGLCVKCPKMQWINNEPPECNLYHNYAALVIPKSGQMSLDCLVIVSMKSTNLKLAKDWNSLMRLRLDENKEQLPMYRGIYELEAQRRSEGKYAWYVAVPKNAGMHKKDSQAGSSCRDAYLAVREMYAAGKLGVEPEHMEEPREPGSDM